MTHPQEQAGGASNSTPEREKTEGMELTQAERELAVSFFQGYISYHWQGCKPEFLKSLFVLYRKLMGKNHPELSRIYELMRNEEDKNALKDLLE